MKLFEKRIKSEQIYKGRIINLFNDQIELPDGKTGFREYVKHPGGICVVPIGKNSEIYLVRQYRYPYGEEVLEIPAGKRDSADEEPLEGGKRELKEELGLTAQNYLFLGEFYPTPGYTDEVIYMYAAWNLLEGESCPDEDEFVEKVKMPLDLLTKKILNGEIKDGKTQAAILKVNALIEQKKIKP